ncbi:MAG: tail fiber domain-containing protein [Acidobacteriota bacterium]
MSFATAIGASSVVSTSNTIVLGRSNGQDTVQVSGVLNVANQYNLGGSRILSIAGTDNLFVGESTGAANTTGNSNVFVGRSAGLSNTIGASNSFFGTAAGSSTTSGGHNSFFGRSAGQSNVTGADNSFFGSSAGVSNTSGDDNAFFGRAAGVSNTTGNSNSFFGRSAGATNSTGVNNSFFGRSAGSATTSGGSNAFFGWSTGDSNTTGANNAFFGAAAGGANTNGTNNTFIGTNAGLSNTTGGSNTYIGVNAGGNPGITNATAIGANATAFQSNGIYIGTATEIVVVPGRILLSGTLTVQEYESGGFSSVCKTVSGALAFCSSSLRYKTNIAPFNSGLSLVNRLRPITFDWKTGGMHDLGLGAEDVAAIEPLLVTYNKDGQIEGVKYDRIGVVLLNAVKEQQQIITAQQHRVEQQEERFRQQELRLEAQQREIEALKNQFFASRRAASHRSTRRR